MEMLRFHLIISVHSTDKTILEINFWVHGGASHLSSVSQPWFTLFCSFSCWLKVSTTRAGKTVALKISEVGYCVCSKGKGVITGLPFFVNSMAYCYIFLPSSLHPSDQRDHKTPVSALLGSMPGELMKWCNSSHGGLVIGTTLKMHLQGRRS